MAEMSVRVVAPDRTAFEGIASSLVAPAWDGQVGVLPRHAPMILLLGAGELVIDRPGGGSETMYVAGGVMKVEDNAVHVLTEYAGEGAPDQLPPDAVLDFDDVTD